MKILRSEAVGKSLGVFFDAEFDFNGPGTPGAIKYCFLYKIFPGEKINKLKTKITDNFRKRKNLDQN